MNTIIINSIFRNEPFAVYAVASVINYVSKAIIYDTGSDDGTFEELQQLQKDYPNKIDLRQEKLENAHNWSIEEGNVKAGEINPVVSKRLADLRREMHEESKDYTWVLLLDGDELYPRYLASKIHKIATDENNKQDVIIPAFCDWLDFKTVRAFHSMCRLFRQNTTEIRNNFPYELHYQKYTGVMYERGCPNSIFIEPEIMCDKYYNDEMSFDSLVSHMESVVKPWRKDKQIVYQLDQPYHPEVIDELWDRFPRIEKYI